MAISKKSLLASVAIIAGGIFAGNANAADMTYPQAGTNWGGFYVGGHIGAGIGEVAYPTSCDCSVTGAGVVGGFQTGYNWDMGSTVWGVEGDFSLADIDVDEQDDEHRHSSDIFASIRGRLGMKVGAAEDTLLYATAGVGWVNGYHQSSAASYDDRISVIAPVVGIGADHKISESMSVRVEGLWYIANKELNSYEFSEDEVTLKDHGVIRLGMNFHF